MKKLYALILLSVIGVVATPAIALAYSDPNPYENYIIQHESSGNPAAMNASGCYGLMQACVLTTAPFGCDGHCDWITLRTYCPNWDTDVRCQLIWFSHYKDSRYGGSWVTAYNFWQANRWW